MSESKAKPVPLPVCPVGGRVRGHVAVAVSPWVDISAAVEPDGCVLLTLDDERGDGLVLELRLHFDALDQMHKASKAARRRAAKK